MTLLYQCVAADPPWGEFGGGKIKRGADRHYPLIRRKEDILVVMTSAPCWTIAPDAHLWLWVTNNFLPDGLWLMKELGFRYVTNRCWAKMTQLNEHQKVYVKQRHGLGQYMWGEHELLLFGVRGKTHRNDTKTRPGTLLLAPRSQVHSEKPEQAYVDIEKVSPGPYLEMFAVRRRHGWVSWGPEAHR